MGENATFTRSRLAFCQFAKSWGQRAACDPQSALCFSHPNVSGETPWLIPGCKAQIGNGGVRKVQVQDRLGAGQGFLTYEPELVAVIDQLPLEVDGAGRR